VYFIEMDFPFYGNKQYLRKKSEERREGEKKEGREEGR
jgi:hypothetical protein